MNTYFACPYNIDAVGFYFHSLDQYVELGAKRTDSFGNPVEEFELQFIDGAPGDAQLFEALSVSQASLSLWFDRTEDLSPVEKAAAFYLAAECGRAADDALDHIEDVVLREGELADAAADLFDELNSDLPEGARMYIDIEAYARDCRLGGDLAEFDFAGSTYTVLNANEF